MSKDNVQEYLEELLEDPKYSGSWALKALADNPPNEKDAKEFAKRLQLRYDEYINTYGDEL